MFTSFVSWFTRQSAAKTQYAPIPDSLSALFDETTIDLDLSNQSLSDLEFKAIVKELHNNAKHGIIQSINLSGNRIAGASSPWLGQVLADFPKLQQLDLSHNHLWGDKTIKQVAWRIKNHPNLITLKIGDNNLGPDGIASLAELFLSTPNLMNIDIGWRCMHRQSGTKADCSGIVFGIPG